VSRWIVLSAALTILAFVLSLYVSFDRTRLLLPEVPTHWGWEGKPDRFTPRDETLGALLALPLTMAGAIGLTLLIPWLSPKAFTIDTFRGPYNSVMAFVVALFGFMHLTLLLAFAGVLGGPDAMRMLLGGMYVFIGLVGNLLGKVRRNFFVGIRTPWTLASETVWNQTHRVGAWLMVAGAALALVTVLLDLPFYTGFAILLVSALSPVVYSLVLCKRLEQQGKLSPSDSAPLVGTREAGNQQG
jgi:uncharacterized membrane protein